MQDSSVELKYIYRLFNLFFRVFTFFFFLHKDLPCWSLIYKCNPGGKKKKKAPLGPLEEKTGASASSVLTQLFNEMKPASINAPIVQLKRRPSHVWTPPAQQSFVEEDFPPTCMKLLNVLCRLDSSACEGQETSCKHVQRQKQSGD